MQLLCDYGYTAIKVIDGGMAAWKAASLPTAGAEKAASQSATDAKAAAAKVKAARAHAIAAKAKQRSADAIRRGAHQMEHVKMVGIPDEPSGKPTVYMERRLD